ncbi:MAG: isocitrate lyase/phosphoenolpyruvate mutase family protein [Deltaproteobacteria bacterium]|nr:isocitrate lyase/phosphoenolpyruvate mutase family protein [Deltaproteobacteria bacterium]
MNKAKMLRELFKKDGVIKIIGAHDGITAKLVELNGFDGVWASGFEISASHGVPDANILTMTQYLEATSIMNDAVSIPVVADCDTGYGNSNNVIHMVKRYEAAGIAAVTIEDKRFPKVNSYIPGRQELAPIAEFVGKILAAKNAQQTKDFMAIARIEALIAGWGQEEALRRAHAYVEAGADAILIHSKSSTPDEIMRFAKAWNFSVPLVIIPTTYPMITLEEINKLGIKMVIYANHGLRASIKAINEVLSEIKREERLDTVDSRIVPMSTVFELQGMTKMKEDENIYLRSGEEPIKVIIPAAGAPHNQESLEPLLQDTPLAMLDVHGKSLLQRNVETLNKSKLYDISVITGYKKDAFTVEGVNYVHNSKYSSEHILRSIMCAEDKMDGKTLIIYSDILFENSLIERLRSVESDLVIVVDNSFSKSLERNKKLDLVVTREALPEGGRILTYGRLYTVAKIGSTFLEEHRGAEFIGITMLSKRGVEIFKKEYHKALAEYGNNPFFEAGNVFQASLTDFLNYLIELGYDVKALQVNSGWMEIHTFDNYRYACSTAKSL